MCSKCNSLMTQASDQIDKLMETVRQFHSETTDWTSAEQTIHFSNMLADTMNHMEPQARLVMARDILTNFSVCLTRLIAAQDIHGVTFS